MDLVNKTKTKIIGILGAILTNRRELKSKIISLVEKLELKVLLVSLLTL